MLTTLTTKLKLITTPDHFKALRATQLAYRNALNLVSCYAFAHGKTSSRRRLQHELYGQVRTQYTLPAQMTCSVFRQVGATYQGLWTKARKNAEARRKGYTKKRFRGLEVIYPALGMWIEEHDYIPAGPLRNAILTNHAVVANPVEYQTEVLWPIQRQEDSVAP